MSISLFTGRKELTMAQYEAIVEIDPNKDYNILDYPELSITNQEMAYALTCNRLFPAGSSFICSDDGTYKKGVAYKIIINSDGSKGWEALSASAEKDNILVLYNDDKTRVYCKRILSVPDIQPNTKFDIIFGTTPIQGTLDITVVGKLSEYKKVGSITRHIGVDYQGETASTVVYKDSNYTQVDKSIAQFIFIGDNFEPLAVDARGLFVIIENNVKSSEFEQSLQNVQVIIEYTGLKTENLDINWLLNITAGESSAGTIPAYTVRPSGYVGSIQNPNRIYGTDGAGGQKTFSINNGGLEYSSDIPRYYNGQIGVSEIPSPLNELQNDLYTVSSIYATVNGGYLQKCVTLKGEAAPTTSTQAYYIGQLYLNTTDNSAYQCIAISESSYTWKLVNEDKFVKSIRNSSGTFEVVYARGKGSSQEDYFMGMAFSDIKGTLMLRESGNYGNAWVGTPIPSADGRYIANLDYLKKYEQCRTGTSDPIGTTVAYYVGQLYLNTTNNTLFKCDSINSDSTYTWTAVCENVAKINTSNTFTALNKFDVRPQVKTNGEYDEVLVRTDAQGLVATQSEITNQTGEKYYCQVLNENGSFRISVHKENVEEELHSITLDKDRLLIDNVQVPTVKSFTGVAISNIFTQVEPIKIRSIKLKFTSDTNFQGCSYDLKTSAAGQAVTNYNEESAPLIATTNEYLHLVRSYSYESNYEFNCGNYKLEWSGSGTPKLSYYGIQYTSASSGAHWIEASTTTDFVVDAVVEIDQ